MPRRDSNICQHFCLQFRVKIVCALLQQFSNYHVVETYWGQCMQRFVAAKKRCYDIKYILEWIGLCPDYVILNQHYDVFYR